MPRITLARGLCTSLALASVLAGCLRRDVAADEPTTKISFANVVPQPAIDKVDLIVMVDNSSSMADKQRILADAVPDLVRGLVQPRCVDKKTRARTNDVADPLKPEGQECPAGSEPAFTPITDMHIGVISSSLGGMGSKTACLPEPGHHNDDKGHLVARGDKPASIAQTGDLGFLAWYPDVARNQNKARHPDPPVPATGSLAGLSSAFQDLIVGVGQDGCGFEAQLESVYRFLVQPDPWTEITHDASDAATYGPKDHVDVELLRQRAAFLRPDSLVAVVMLSDEDDSSLDPLAFQGSAWRFEERDEVLPLPTAVCATDPASAKCTSCAFAPQADGCGGHAFYGPQETPLNTRFASMKQRFGVDPRFPLSRYVDAFTKKVVPSRDNEHDKGVYVGKPDCTNPLFAAHLPSGTGEELCKLPKGPRTPDLVYFAVIGGVPNTLLPADGNLGAVDWTRILGKDPSKLDETGIDPHMIVSTVPRGGLPGPTAADDADPLVGREWNTGGDDLEYACTFDLFARNPDGTASPAPHACAAGDGTCDCKAGSDAPVCSKTDRMLQVKGKAYPTRRELGVAKELGNHGIVASLCPKQLKTPGADDYGYRPAVRAISDRLEATLTASCVPRPLERDGNGSVPCLVLATLPEPGPQDTCKKLGLGVPSADILAQVRERAAQEDGEASRLLPVCDVPQVVVPRGETCRDQDQANGFCYAEAVPDVKCAQSILFTKPTTKLVGARFSLQCIALGDAK
jgi:hypothetical protein